MRANYQENRKTNLYHKEKKKNNDPNTRKLQLDASLLMTIYLTCCIVKGLSAASVNWRRFFVYPHYNILENI